MNHRGGMLYQVQLAMLNVEESIERHANLALAQVQVEAWQASRYFDLKMEEYKIQDIFRNRSRGQKRRHERNRK